LLPNASTEWIEIYNASTSGIDIGGYIIDDLLSGGSALFTIPAGTDYKSKGIFCMENFSLF
jgi:hypothetical protein